MSATRSGLMAPAGRSASTVTSAAAAGTLPMTTPPSLTKSWGLRSRALPTPTTTRRDASSPIGATMSRAEPFFPLKRSATAARASRSPVGSSALRAADPSFTPSSQHTTRTPLAGVANGANPSFTTRDMGVCPSGSGLWPGRGDRNRYDPLPPALQSPAPPDLLQTASPTPPLPAGNARNLPFVVHAQGLCLGEAILFRDQ